MHMVVKNFQLKGTIMHHSQLAASTLIQLLSHGKSCAIINVMQIVGDIMTEDNVFCNC